MREPDIHIDGWCLEDGEQLNREAPETFHIPDLAIRKILQPGDFAKLIFKLATADEANPETFERMWVIVRTRIPGGYLGILDNEPSGIQENGKCCRGIELPFLAKHIIAVHHGNDASRSLASKFPRREWA